MVIAEVAVLVERDDNQTGKPAGEWTRIHV